MNRRLVSLVLPPVLALLGAAAYIEYRTAEAAREVAQFCASVEPGLTALDFMERALARELEVHDFGVDLPTVVASRKVYGWQEEIHECRGERDAAGRIRAVQTGRRVVSP